MIGVIIQARMGSTRLPNKTMYSIMDKPLLAYSINRAEMARYVDKVIVATTSNERDDEIANWCLKEKKTYFRGNEQDVLDRYYRAAKENNLDIIVRVTSDCPFVDPNIIDMLILYLKNFNCDYVSNRWKVRSWPHGLDVEVFTMDALEKAWKEASTQIEREHVTPYILQNEKKFNIIEVSYNENLSDIRLTVDYNVDMKFVEQVMPKVITQYGEDFSWIELINLLKDNPQLLEINKEKCDIKLY